ncbi:MAG: sulfite exporter TauE/SafE family protein [Rhodospirillaceae bacterium]|jgi:hypothetical protein|nr:sulfite exporter TauE/SafE family protein [Rhodospirillaceae bacterium]MBT4589023.1 sulfite exporter TauE/SafE family protein [Rhodospirillaceae bacterium]MBT4939668.1 sulfite exporter TauE/SafE family protein [Rhodospirillaceae bacterium]MBT5941468.1 sulfite exporter TauE/SafE family protein [Rhodospirillaceae bacterium]MBT7265288.1 sulfite exporter TauE/SafE family protein [Rhodospirillaceae bacterium]
MDFNIFAEVLDTSLLIGTGVAFVSAVIQGYSGFGGGLVVVPILAILFGPIEAIAITSIAGLLGNVLLWPDAIKKAYWPEAAPLSIAAAIAIPIGLLFLTTADPTLIRRGMGVFILVVAALLMSGWIYKGQRNVFTSGVAGALTGGVMGSFGMPAGPFMVIYYMSAPVAPPIQRANIIISVGVALLFMLGGLIISGAYHETTIARTIIITPVFLAGTWTGRYLFNVAPLSWFKKAVYVILIATGVSILLV